VAVRTRFPFDVLGSASFLVDDHKRAAGSLETTVGFPPPKPHWVLDQPGTGINVTFLRAGSVKTSPTPVEIVQPTAIPHDADPASVTPHIAAVARSQGDRPIKVHATDIGIADIDGMIERLRTEGRRHWIQGVRVWVGIDGHRPGAYLSDGDGGLHLEFLPTSALRLPPEAAEPRSMPTSLRNEGEMVALAWRTFLVSDLGAVLDELAGSFDWLPEGSVERSEDGSHRAILGFGYERSTRLELLQPAGDGEDAIALRKWGPGAWSLTVAVDGLDAKVDDLERRGTPFKEIHTGFDRPSRLVRAAGSSTPGCLFDFVDATEVLLPRTNTD
jgi:hypothetical protein